MITFEMIAYMALMIAAGVFWFWFLERRDRMKAEAKSKDNKDVRETDKLLKAMLKKQMEEKEDDNARVNN